MARSWIVVGGGMIAIAVVPESIGPTADEQGRLGRRFLLRNLTCGQLGFASFWAVRGVLALDQPATVTAFSAAAVVAATVATIGVAWRRIGRVARPDFSHAAVRRTMRFATGATVAQLVVSIVVSSLVGLAGWDAWVAPSVVTTIGLFLIAIGLDLDVLPTVRLGAAMTAVSLALPRAWPMQERQSPSRRRPRCSSRHPRCRARWRVSELHHRDRRRCRSEGNQ